MFISNPLSGSIFAFRITSSKTFIYETKIIFCSIVTKSVVFNITFIHCSFYICADIHNVYWKLLSNLYWLERKLSAGMEWFNGARNSRYSQCNQNYECIHYFAVINELRIRSSECSSDFRFVFFKHGCN